ncbi:MAG: hypothetical protein JXM73_20280 [Anaerolineae bacterium]|nr:hypothetical protein [Anaerolineae bacterium]
MTNRRYIVAAISALLVVLLLGCTVGRGEVGQVTPTPTKTPRPVLTATLTPTPTAPPTGTPTPTPTDTPAPPTETSIPPTEAPITAPPTDTPAPPTDTAAPPTNTPRPAATKTPVPPTRTETPVPKVDFRVVQQDLIPKSENTGGLYTIYIRVEDAAGNPLDDLIVWNMVGPAIEARTGDKPLYYHAEILMGAGDYHLEVKGFRSERTKRLTTMRDGISNADLIKAGYCVNEADCETNVKWQHFSWRVIFRRTW